MATYTIAYDLLPPHVKYAEMIKRLRRLEPGRPIERLIADVGVNPDSTYILVSPISAIEIMSDLRSPGGIDHNDRVLIAEIFGEIVRHPATISAIAPLKPQNFQ